MPCTGKGFEKNKVPSFPQVIQFGRGLVVPIEGQKPYLFDKNRQATGQGLAEGQIKSDQPITEEKGKEGPQTEKGGEGKGILSVYSLSHHK